MGDGIVQQFQTVTGEFPHTTRSPRTPAKSQRVRAHTSARACSNVCLPMGIRGNLRLLSNSFNKLERILIYFYTWFWIYPKHIVMDIRSDIPFSDVKSRAGRPAKYPWPTMAVGDSFDVPIHALTNIRLLAKGYGDRNGKQFKVGRLPDGAYRCWRLA